MELFSLESQNLPALSNEINSLDFSFDSIEKSINNMASSLSLLDNAIKNVTDGTYLSGQEISKLIIKYPELSDKILQKFREEKINEQKTSIQAEIDITAKTLQSIKSRLVGYQSEIRAINNVAQAKVTLSEIEEQSKKENFFTKLWRGITGKPQITKVKSDLEQYIDLSQKVENAQSKINALNTSLLLVSMPNYTQASNNASKSTKDHNKALNDNKKALDNEYNQFKDSTDKRIKVIEDYLHHEGQIRIDAMNLIEGKSQEFYNNLMRYNIDYGDGMTSTVIGAWNNAYSALSRFNSGQINVANTLGSISGQISGIASQIESANKAMNNLGNTSRETAKALNLSAREYKNVNNEEKTSEITRLQRLIEQISTQRGAEPSLSYYRRKLYDLRGYASGTLSSKKGLATIDENGKEIILDKSSPGRYRLMNEGDVVFSHEATKKLWDFAN